MKRILTIVLALAFICPPSLQGQSKQVIRVGAKHFNEGYILSEMIAILLEDAGFEVERRFHLGGTAVTFEALRNKAIDIYPEYSGTINHEILKQGNRLTMDQIHALVKAKFGLEISDSYGFNNSYALVMIRGEAAKLGVEKISDLAKHPQLTPGLSYEFIKRQDGWEALAPFYQLPQTAVALEHGLAYKALLQDQIDITDAYSTDGELKKYGLKLLEDDKNFFPDYHPVSLYSASLPKEAKAVIEKLENSISDEEMQSLNALALFDKKSHFVIARDFLANKNLIDAHRREGVSDWEEILDKTFIHLQLTLAALLSAVLVAFPLGLFIYNKPVFAKTVLYFTGILQTVPSIALLALMIPLFGIGMVPALVALFLYALLPILRNTVIGLFSVDPELKRVASAIGIDDNKRLFMVEVPLAMPTIITGVRTAAVINVGTATLAAFIGAGGLGEFIVTGLALNNTTLILKGAIPAALLAISMELGFERIEKLLIPKHLRSKRF